MSNAHETPSATPPAPVKLKTKSRTPKRVRMSRVVAGYLVSVEKMKEWSEVVGKGERLGPSITPLYAVTLRAIQKFNTIVLISTEPQAYGCIILTKAHYDYPDNVVLLKEDFRPKGLDQGALDMLRAGGLHEGDWKFVSLEWNGFIPYLPDHLRQRPFVGSLQSSKPVSR